VQDKRAVSVDMGRFKGAKNKYNVIRDGLHDRLRVNKVTEKLTIKCLRPSPGDRIDVVFADKDKGIEAKQHTRWLSSSLAGARVNGEQWYPVNSSMSSNEEQLQAKLQTIKDADKEEWVEVLTLSSGRGTRVDLLLYADLNRHHELCGGTQAFGEAGRTDEAEPIVDFMQENALTSLLPSERVI
jgi:hypothetical protein